MASGIALLAVVIAYRGSRRHDNLLHEHSALLSARVSELDRFAGRVAHAACAVGVIASIAQNLLRNAIAYMGSRPLRRIVVRGRALFWVELPVASDRGVSTSTS